MAPEVSMKQAKKTFDLVKRPIFSGCFNTNISLSNQQSVNNSKKMAEKTGNSPNSQY